jgi:hypothetical protein
LRAPERSAGKSASGVDGGTAGVWLVEPAETADGDPDAEETGWYALRDAGVAGVRAALDTLLDGAPGEGGLPWGR